MINYFLLFLLCTTLNLSLNKLSFRVESIKKQEIHMTEEYP